MRAGRIARRVVGYSIGGIMLLAVLVIVTVWGLTQTSTGRERVRRQLVGLLEGPIHGIVEMGELDGNLLTGATIRDFAIKDSAGVPFFVASEIRARYSLNGILRGKRLWFDDVTVVRPLLLFDKPPGGEWNLSRLFPKDTTPDDPNKKPGWGAWLAFRNVRLIDGRILSRAEWEPDTGLTAVQRDSAVREALAGGLRARIVEAKGGYQKIIQMHRINGRFPLIRLSDPDAKPVRIEAATASLIAEPFNPPVADIRNLAGAFEITGDSVTFPDVRVRLAHTVASGGGTYYSESGDLVMRVKGAPAAFSDFRWVYPRFPSQGGGALDLSLELRKVYSRYIVKNGDVRTGTAHVTGNADVTFDTTTIRVRKTDLRFAGLGTALIEQLVPIVDAPRSGTLGGRLALDGTPAMMQVNGDVTFDDSEYGRNRVIAVGAIGSDSSQVIARDLRLSLLPVQVAFARMAMPDIPVGGTVSGTARLAGSTRTGMSGVLDLTHEDRGERSRIAGNGSVRLGGPVLVAFDGRVLPLSLVTVGRFAPAVGLRGAAAGPVKIEGTLGALDFNTDLAVTGGGGVRAQGRLDLEGAVKSYDLRMGATLFNANSVVGKAPQTSMTMTAVAAGTGFDPATMTSRIAADISTSSYDSISVDSARVRLSIGGGLLTAEQITLRAPGTTVDAAGTIGLVAGRDGEFSYKVAIDTLATFARWFPKSDTGIVQPRPAIVARAVAKARADSSRIAQASEVEREITGAPAPRLVVDTPSTVRRDSVGGAVYAAGIIRGALQRFSVRGRAGGVGLVVNGNTVGAVRTEYLWHNARTPQSVLAVGARLDTVVLAGFEFDSVDTRVSYGATGDGTAQIVAFQEQQEYSVAAEYTLNNEANVVRLSNLRLRFDTTVWASVRPGAVRWGSRGIEVETIDLRSAPNGRIYVNGLLPTEGVANLEVAIDNFEVGNFVKLLQSDFDARGLVTLHARAAGTTRDPRLRGALAAEEFSWNGSRLPELRTTFEYASERLVAHAEVVDSGIVRPMAILDASVPLNLAFGGEATGPRLPDAPVTIDFKADSLPLEFLPAFTDAIASIRGYARGDVEWRGTLRRPVLAGKMELSAAQARLVPLGVTLRRVNGAVSLKGDTVVIDSLVGYSRGQVRISGGLGVGSFRAPSFDLRLTAQNALVLDTDRGRLRADADIALYGPFDGARASGGVRVREGVIYPPQDSKNVTVLSAGDPAVFRVIDTALVNEQELLPAQSPLLSNLRMRINLRVDRDVWMRSQNMNIEVYSDGDLVLDVDNSRQALTLDGVMLTERGEYTFLSKRFQIKRGAATFIGTPELNPTIQATGEYEVRLAGREALVIRLLIGGTLRAPRLVLESDAQPPIAQSDLLSYLAFGRSSSSLLQLEASGVSSGGGSGGLVGATAALATTRLAAVALGVLVSEVEGDATRALGADVLNITPADVQTEVFSVSGAGNFLRGTEIEYGKYFRSNILPDAQTFISILARPDPGTLPGIRYQIRTTKGYRLETSFEPRYQIQAPSLSVQKPASFNVFGLFLVREWRF